MTKPLRVLLAKALMERDEAREWAIKMKEQRDREAKEKLSLWEAEHEEWLKEAMARNDLEFELGLAIEGLEQLFAWMEDDLDERDGREIINDTLVKIKVHKLNPNPTISDGFGSVWSERCPKCGQLTMQVVGVGDARCCECDA